MKNYNAYKYYKYNVLLHLLLGFLLTRLFIDFVLYFPENNIVIYIAIILSAILLFLIMDFPALIKKEYKWIPWVILLLCSAIIIAPIYNNRILSDFIYTSLSYTFFCIIIAILFTIWHINKNPDFDYRIFVGIFVICLVVTMLIWFLNYFNVLSFPDIILYASLFFTLFWVVILGSWFINHKNLSQFQKNVLTLLFFTCLLTAITIGFLHYFDLVVFPEFVLILLPPIILILFTILLSYDINTFYEKWVYFDNRSCVDKDGKCLETYIHPDNAPDVIKDSIDMYYDILNIFTNFQGIQGFRAIRGLPEIGTLIKDNFKKS